MKATVTFCDQCYDVAKLHSPNTLSTWITLCMCALSMKRPLHINEFVRFTFDLTGIREPQLRKCMLILEDGGYMLTHEIADAIWVFPLGIRRENEHHLHICANCH